MITVFKNNIQSHPKIQERKTSSLCVYTKLEIRTQKQLNFSVCLRKNPASVSFFSYLLWANFQNIFFSHKTHQGFYFKVHKNKRILLENLGILAFFLNILFYFIHYQIIWMAHSPIQSNIFFFSSYYVQDKVNRDLTFEVLEVWQSRKTLHI